MALPKRKTAQARQGKRRSHLAAKMPALAACPQCHEMMRPHRACANCGTYQGRQVMEPAAKQSA